MAAKKFPLGRVKELAAHVKGLHEHLQSLIADCDTDDAGKPAQDLSDRDAPYAQGQDAKTVKSMDEAFPGIGRLGRGGCG
jgi:hypothetical protein